MTNSILESIPSYILYVTHLFFHISKKYPEYSDLNIFQEEVDYYDNAPAYPENSHPPEESEEEDIHLSLEEQLEMKEKCTNAMGSPS